MKAEELYLKGVTVVDQKELSVKHLRELIDGIYHDAPEFNHGVIPKGTYSVELKTWETDGSKSSNAYAFGFSAASFPSAFHHPNTRLIRKMYCDVVEPLMTVLGRRMWGSTELKGRVLFDRPRVVPVNVVSSSGAADRNVHKDLCPDAWRGENAVFGGWINCDNQPQTFACIPGSHIPMTRDYGKHESGFALNQKLKNKDMEKITVKPGQIIIFYQSIDHAVTSLTPRAEESKRLYLGYHLSNDQHICPAIEEQVNEWMDEMTLPDLPSGEKPEFYPKSYIQYWQSKLRAWAQECVNAKLLGTNGLPQRVITLKVADMLAMDSSPLLYPTYSHEERYTMLFHKLKFSLA